MNKLIAAFMLFYLVNVILDAVMASGGGMATTHLTAGITDSATTVNVLSTSGFLSSDVITIGDEKIRYTGRTGTTFTVPAGGRGYDGTDARAHASGSKAYSTSTSTINSALGFNVASTGATVGTVDMMVAVQSFFFTTLPKLITWDFMHFRINEWLQMLRYVFIAISVGFIIYMIFQLINSLGGVMQSIFVRP